MSEEPKENAWSSFCSAFTEKNGYRWSGDQLIDRIEEWAKAWPEDVELAGCDDTCHAKSLLCLIAHRGVTGELEGTTVVFVPQCTGEGPTVFILWPEETKRLIGVLQTTLRPSPGRR